jgi:hypothetical protein
LEILFADQREACIEDKELLCITMEIFANQESPQGSKQKRMEVQVAQLANKMKQSESIDTEKEIQRLLSRWHSTGFLYPSESQEFEQRFYSALESLDKDYQYPNEAKHELIR